MKNDSKAPQPMDPSAREGVSPERVVRNVRHAYALDTLVEEVEQAFGEVPVIYGEPDEWQVIHDVRFDSHGVENLVDVLTGLYHDKRVAEVDPDDEETLIDVRLQHNRQIRDSRDGFGIAALLEVYREDPVLP